MPLANVRPDISEADGILRIKLPHRFGGRRVVTALVLAGFGVTAGQRGSWLLLIIGIAAVAAAFYIALHREFIRASPDGITLGTRLAFLQRAHRYPASEVRNLRTLSGSRPGDQMSSAPLLAFEHQDRTVRFGAGITPSVAAVIRDRICSRVPEAGQPRSVLGLAD